MKLLCEECSWHGSDSEMLSATNPFDEQDTITGCPKCKSINTLREACEVNDCWAGSTCGTPTPGGYVRTCGKHCPDL